MIEVIVQFFDVLACVVIWWSAAAMLAGGHQVNTFRSALLVAGLIGVMVCSFVAALALLVTPIDPEWWATGLRIAGAVVAGSFYEYRFGVTRHLRMLKTWAAGTFFFWRRA